MLYSLLQIHELNARNMYKDDKYCRRLIAWNDFISRDFVTIPVCRYFFLTKESETFQHF
jgi:hypothetical protein